VSAHQSAEPDLQRLGERVESSLADGEGVAGGRSYDSASNTCRATNRETRAVRRPAANSAYAALALQPVIWLRSPSSAKSGAAYANVHTVTRPGGEIRGQINCVNAWLARYVAEPNRMLAGAVRGVRLLDS